jgi:hypothetical protein
VRFAHFSQQAVVAGIHPQPLQGAAQNVIAVS